MNSSNMRLPTDKIAFVDIEGHGTDIRWCKYRAIYTVCFLKVEGKKHVIRRIRDINKAVLYARDLLDKGWTLVMHNAKFDYGVLQLHGLGHKIEKGKPSIVCTQVMEYHRDSDREGGFSLDALTGIKTDILAVCKEQDLIPEKMSKAEFWQTDWSNNPEVLALIEDYCVQDLRATVKLYKRTAAWYNLPENSKFTKALLDIEFPMLDPLTALERNGMPIDLDALDGLGNELSAELLELKERVNKLYPVLPELQWNEETNAFIPVEKLYTKRSMANKDKKLTWGLNSIEQPLMKNREPEVVGCYTNKATVVSHYMDREGCIKASDPYTIYDHCPLVPFNPAPATGHIWWLLTGINPELLSGAKINKKSKKPSINKEFISKLELPPELPLAKINIVTKALSMTETIRKNLKWDNRLHGNFNNCLTKTGRLSTSQPNLQNFPRADKDPNSIGSRFRKLVRASTSEYSILVADLDRIEVVVLAWFLYVSEKDDSLLKVCADPEADIHQANADNWGLTRDQAKKLLFSLIYGATEHKVLADGLADTLEGAKAIIDQVYSSQPSLLTLKERLWNKAEKLGYVTNPFGCHVLYPDLRSKQEWVRSKGQRESFNCLIQRTARDILHLLLIDSLPVIERFGALLVNVVHDEVIVECISSDAENLKEALNEVWQKRFDILKGARINGDWNIGNSWFEAK